MRYLIIPLLFCFIIVESGTAQNKPTEKQPSNISRAELTDIYASVDSDYLAHLTRQELPLASIDDIPALKNGVIEEPNSLLSMNQEEISGYSSMAEFIQSRLAGVTVTQNPASPYGYNIIIRGKKSLMASSMPLIVLNDIALPSFNLNSLDPAHVKSIDVLKGPDATMYGSRGANGVIVIDTK